MREGLNSTGQTVHHLVKKIVGAAITGGRGARQTSTGWLHLPSPRGRAVTRWRRCTTILTPSLRPPSTFEITQLLGTSLKQHYKMKERGWEKRNVLERGDRSDGCWLSWCRCRLPPRRTLKEKARWTWAWARADRAHRGSHVQSKVAAQSLHDLLPLPFIKKKQKQKKYKWEN